MLPWFDYLRFVVALFSITDPFAAIPLFLVLTERQSQSAKARTARTAGIFAAAVLIVAAFSGDLVLRLIGASLGAFQVGGGLILLLMAIAMVNAQLSPQQQTQEEAEEASDRNAVGVVPLAMPLLVGPGAISATIIQMQRGEGLAHQAVVILAVLAVCFTIWLVLRLALPIGKRLGRTGLNILNRIFGLLLAAIAVQIFANGLRALFPVLNG